MSKNKFLVGTAEGFIYCFLVYLIFYQYSNFKLEYLTMNIHPLAVIVGVIAIRYGIYGSLPTVFFAFVFYILGYLKLGNDPVIFFSTFEYYKFILIFFFTALILGRNRDKFIRRIFDLNFENKKLQEAYQIQQKNNTSLIKINEVLKTQIINSKESILTLHKITSSMKRVRVERLYTKVIQNLIQFLNCDVLSIYGYSKEKNIMRAKIKFGKSRLPNFLSLDKEITPFHQVIAAGSPMQFPLEEEGIYPIYISPIIQDGETIGFINIERLKFAVKDKFLFELFKVITEWMNDSISDAFNREKIEMEANCYKNTQIFNLTYFNDQMEEEERRKKLFQMEFAAFEGKNPGISPEEFYSRLRGKIWETDIVGMDENIIRILFTNTVGNSKALLKERLKKITEEVEFYEI